jgi:3'(2'), 5'-bisphosphate nucleotidase
MINDELEFLLQVAGEAASLISEVYAEPFSVDYKGPRDPVTVADRRANDLICKRLGQAYPHVPIVAEESDPASFEGYQTSERVFFVDPLDGTREFVDRNGEFVVMIGLLEDQRPTLGVIFAPAMQRAWIGRVGAGAFRIEADGTRHPLTVSVLGELGKATVVGSRSHRDEAVERALAILGVSKLVALGSAGLKSAAVASGDADAYVAPFYAGKRWDACAADALITAAGGRFSDAFGLPFDYRAKQLANDRGIVATNGLVHEALLARLAEYRTTEGRAPDED